MEKEWVSKMGTFVGTLLCILILLGCSYKLHTVV